MRMMIGRYIQLVLIFSIIHAISFGQGQVTAGIGLGYMQYEGDLGGRSSRLPDLLTNTTSQPSQTGSISLSYYPFSFAGIRMQGTLGQVQGADSLLSRITAAPLLKKTRNLHFKSAIREVSMLIEIHPLLLPYRGGSKKGKVSPYLLAGAGLFGYNPRALYMDPNGNLSWIDLRPLRTEGQGMAAYPGIAAYKTIAYNFQAGAGIRWKISSRIAAGVEILFRKTSTDHLDDVSGQFIDNNAIDDFFGPGTLLAAQAKQMSNNPAYNNGGSYITGFEPGNLRGSARVKDYYYTSTLFIHYNFARSTSLMNPMRSTSCPTF
ncbi:MAG: hypothetical protein RLZZ557_244 [Bacteroidota bacterium]